MYVGGEVKERFLDSYSVVAPVLTEQIPILHYYPNNCFLMVGTVGCNFRCIGCVSRLITNVDVGKYLLRRLSPEEVVRVAKKLSGIGIVFGINDPVTSYYTFLRLATKAKEERLLVGCSTNLYFTEEALNGLIPYLDFVNVGVKGFSDVTYRRFCGAPSSKPVLRNLKLLIERGVHVEVSVVYARGFESEIVEVGKYVSSLSREVPLHVMKFVPYNECEYGLEPSISECESLLTELRRYLRYVYLFNVPTLKHLSTLSDDDGVIVERAFYGPMAAKVIRWCGRNLSKAGIKGYFGDGSLPRKEVWPSYRILGAFKVVRDLLKRYFSVKSDAKVLRLLSTYPEVLDRLSQVLNSPKSVYDYVDLLNHLSKLLRKPCEGCSYVLEVLKEVEVLRSMVGIPPRAYVTLGHPLYARKAGHLQVKLVEFIGAECVNNELSRGEEVGPNTTPEELNRLNPNVVIIEPHFPWSPEKFIAACRELGIDVEAVREGRVIKVPKNLESLAMLPELTILLAKAIYREPLQKLMP